MTPRSKRIIKSSLLKKGFEQQEGSNHQKFRLRLDGKKTEIFTLCSHGVTDCDDAILGEMAKQLKLSRRQFNDLIDCLLDKEAYAKILRANGDIR